MESRDTNVEEDEFWVLSLSIVVIEEAFRVVVKELKVRAFRLINQAWKRRLQ